MVRLTWEERIATLTTEQRKIVLSTREIAGVHAAYRILAQYEQKNTDTRSNNKGG